MSFPLLRPLLCVHPVAQGIAVGLVAALIIHCAIAAIAHRRCYRSVVLAYASLFLLALGLGSYLVSPLGFSSGHIPLLRGFLITRSHGVPLTVVSGQTVSLGYGSIVEIQPDVLAGPVDCTWASATGGAFEDPANCDTAYTPGRGTQYDVLKIRVRSECSLPTSIGEIKVSILP